MISIVFLFAAYFTGYAQFSGKEIFIDNRLLQIELSRYLAYTEQWAQQQKAEGYIMKMQSESAGNGYTTFKFGILLVDTDVWNFNPSSLTVVSGKPVLIKSGHEAFFKTDSVFITALMNKFGKGLINEAKFRNAQLAEHQDWVKEQADSVSLVTSNGIKKVPAKDMKPIIKSASSTYANLPQTWELIFRIDQLEQIKQYN